MYQGSLLNIMSQLLNVIRPIIVRIIMHLEVAMSVFLKCFDIPSWYDL